MVGPGTGLAPFRSFIQERQLVGTTSDNLLFFGCRHRNHDYIYKEELEIADSNKVIKLFTAFSREEDHKVYVQHKIIQSGDLVSSLLLRKDAYLYICGDARAMPKDVQEAIINVLSKKMEPAAALELLNNMKHEGRFQQDTWF